MNFVSDHLFGIDDSIIAAIIGANQSLTASSYGADEWTARAAALVGEIFEHQVDVFLVTSGTAANALGLSAMVQPYNAILAHGMAHIMVDECGAPEFYTAGAKIYGIDTPAAKLTIESLEAMLATFVRGEHNSKPAAISITQSTELGTVYSTQEVAEIGQFSRSHGLKLHMDGARFANAVASLKCSPADITWKAGVDVMSFGVTKNGGMGVDAVVFFDRELAADFAYRRMRAGLLLSKSRFLGAQMEAYLTDDLWLRNARLANSHAQRLLKGLEGQANIRVPLGAQANQLFAIVSKALHEYLREHGAQYAVWPQSGYELDNPVGDELLIRLVTSFKTDPRHVDAFIKAVAAFDDQ